MALCGDGRQSVRGTGAVVGVEPTRSAIGDTPVANQSTYTARHRLTAIPGGSAVAIMMLMSDGKIIW